MTVEEIVESLTNGVARVGAVGLAGLGPSDPPKQWLQIVGYMAQCSGQWPSYRQNLLSSAQFLDSLLRRGCSLSITFIPLQVYGTEE